MDGSNNPASAKPVSFAFPRRSSNTFSGCISLEERACKEVSSLETLEWQSYEQGRGGRIYMRGKGILSTNALYRAFWQLGVPREGVECETRLLQCLERIAIAFVV